MDAEEQQGALPPDLEEVLRRALAGIYPPGFPETEAGKSALAVEIHDRPYWFRKRYIPWILSHFALRGARVLEIGSGTGTSAIPLAEQGADVFSVDLNAPGLEVALVRAQLHGLADLVHTCPGNAEEIASLFPGQTFDVIAYFASLEHMTFGERVTTLRAAWSMLRAGGLLVAVDTPNRIWYYDEHTAFENFFHWLPDDVAIAYANLTKRDGFNTDFQRQDDGAQLRLARWGRGVSYHDFEIAIGELGGLEISGEWEFRRGTDPAWAEWWKTQPAGRFHDFLCSVAPEIPAAFLEPEIALSLRKPN